jgi:hypothetical protein
MNTTADRRQYNRQPNENVVLPMLGAIQDNDERGSSSQNNTTENQQHKNAADK